MPKNRPTLIGGAILGTLILCFCVFYFSIVNADGGMIDDVYRALMRFAAEALLSLGELCMRFSVFFLSFFIALARWNNYIDVPIVMLGWTMVRDVANMFFVIILLIIAIGTILGLEQYQWNKTLAKMILAAVFINFSNLICGILIDIAHVFTITFVNAIAATAGGNLINMFHLNDLFTLVNDSGGNPENSLQDMDLRLFAAAAAAFCFALLSLVTIAVYCIIMLYRVVILWVLVILSPIAYISSVLPQSQSYAKEWWDEFGRYVLVAPMMVFFLWLAFATMGEGQIMSDMKLEFTSTEGQYTAEELSGGGGTEKTAASLSKITEWANLVNLLIPICLLWVGLERVQKLGVRGGDMVSKGMDMFKNVATIATGFAAGRWLAKKGWEGTKAVGKGALYHMPVVGGQAWVERAKLVGARAKDFWYHDIGARGGKWNPLSMMARSTARRRKHIKAGEGAAEAAESLLGKMQAAGQWGNRARNRRGQLEAYEERSNARDAEGVQSAKLAELQLPRMKDGRAYVNPETGEVSTLAGEAARFALRKEALEDEQKTLIGGERAKILNRARPDMEKASADSEQAREGLKSEEVQKAEAAEQAAQKVFRASESQVKVAVEAEVKKDEDGTIGSAQKALDLAKNDEKKIDKELGKLKKDGDYVRLAEEQSDLKKAETAKKELEKQRDNPDATYTDAEKAAFAQKIQKEDEKIAKLNASILGNTKGAEVEGNVKEKEADKQDAKNRMDSAQKAIADRMKAITEKVEKETVTADGTTVAAQREAYEKAGQRVNVVRKAWKETQALAEASPDATVTPEERERAKAMADALQQVAAEVEEKIANDEVLGTVKKTLTATEKEIADAEEALKNLKAQKLSVAPPSSPEEKARRAEAKAQLEANDKLGKYDGKTPVDELLNKLHQEHGWLEDEKSREYVQAYVDASKEEHNAGLDTQINATESEITKKKAEAAEASKAFAERQKTLVLQVEAESVEISGEEGPVPLEQLRQDSEAAQQKVAVADQAERDQTVKKKLEKIEADLFTGNLLGSDGQPVMANGKPVKRADSNIAIAYLQAKQRAAATGANVEEEETEAQKIMLGLESFSALFASEVASKMGAEASKAFIDGIKDKKTGELFEKGAKELEKALKDGMAAGKQKLEGLKLTNVGARMSQAQMISEYHKDISGAQKREAADHAESIFTLERYGFKAPSKAFEEWVKKQTERLQGVEREQSVKNAMGTLSQFIKLQAQGKEITTDQKAQMMAHLKHLTSNGWMDDLLAGIASKASGKNKLFGEEREEAEALEHVFIQQLGWDPNDNRSGADRTAQVQKIVGMGGDLKQEQGEEGLLWIMENTNRKYSEANKHLAETIFENKDAIVGAGANDDTRRQVALKAGMITQDQVDRMGTDTKAKSAVQAGINQLLAYTEKFALPAASAEQAATAFMESMDKFQEAFEMLADFKNLAMNTGHIDDGGHTYYDMAEGKVRGNLGHRGKEFVLGEWRKLGLDQRLSKLKTHSLGHMNEDFQTIDYTAGEECDDAIRETFAGLCNQREFAKVDGRNKDHISGMASGEAIRQSASGKTKIGDDDSVYFKGTFGHIVNQDQRRQAVKKRLRGNYAAFLRNNPAALFGALAERSGLSFEEGMVGHINVNVCGEDITNVEELVNWVNSDPDGEFQFNPTHIRRALAKAKKNKNDD